MLEFSIMESTVGWWVSVSLTADWWSVSEYIAGVKHFVCTLGLAFIFTQEKLCVDFTLVYIATAVANCIGDIFVSNNNYNCS